MDNKIFNRIKWNGIVKRIKSSNFLILSLILSMNFESRLPQQADLHFLGESSFQQLCECILSAFQTSVADSLLPMCPVFSYHTSEAQLCRLSQFFGKLATGVDVIVGLNRMCCPLEGDFRRRSLDGHSSSSSFVLASPFKTRCNLSSSHTFLKRTITSVPKPSLLVLRNWEQ